MMLDDQKVIVRVRRIKGGRAVHLEIEAPPDVVIYRDELRNFKPHKSRTV